jgi:hypothetical protein
MTMDGMTPAHARDNWTWPQAILAGAAGLFAAAITPLFFASLFMAVRDLLQSSSYGAWPWIVPLATEGCFMVLFLLDVVTVLRRKPRGRLRFAPYLFAAGSLVLNFLAGRGHPAAITGHVMVTLAFFVTVIEGEDAVRKLAVADKDARVAEMMADARRYAIDVVRDRRGRLWRWRVPVLLRRDIRTGRLCDEVRAAVELAVSVGRTSGWRQPVLDWVTRELRLTDEAEAADRKALQEITRKSSEATAQDAPERAPEGMPREDSQKPPRKDAGTTAQDGSEILPRLTAAKAKTMTPAQLAPYVEALMDEHGNVPVSRVMDRCHVGQPKAKEAIEEAARLRRRRTVVAIGERKQA